MSPDTYHTPLTIDVERNGDTATVRCHGRLVAGVGDWFYPEMRNLLPECKCITLDLTDLAYMDSMGIGTVVRLYVTARSNACTLRLINIGPRVRELLGITHLLNILTDMCEQGISMRF